MDRRRHSDLMDLEKLSQLHVTVIGIGAIGSCTVAALAKMGVGRITMYDKDIVAEHNLPNQWFGLSDIGKPKVDAMKDWLDLLVDDVVIEPINERYMRQPLSEVVICCIDSMEGRHSIWRSVKRQRSKTGDPKLYVDTRMGAELGQVYAIRESESMVYQRDNMFDPSKALPLPCTAKSTIYGAMICAAGACAQVKRWMTEDEVVPKQELDLVGGSSWSIFAEDYKEGAA